jgi:hypothetical protein
VEDLDEVSPADLFPVTRFPFSKAVRHIFSQERLSEFSSQIAASRDLAATLNRPKTNADLVQEY